MSTEQNNTSHTQKHDEGRRERQWPHWFSIILFSIVSFGLFVFNQAYITPLLLGFILAALSYPMYNFLLGIIKFKFLKQALASGVTIIFIVTCFVTLVNVMTRELVKEIPKFGDSLVSFLDQVPSNSTVLSFASNFGLQKEDLENLVTQVKSETTSSTFTLNGTSTNSNSGNTSKDFTQLFSQENISAALNVSTQAFNYIFNQLIYLVIFILAWFNGLVNGKAWLDNLFDIMPLDDKEVNSIKLDLKRGIQNVIYANLLSGIVNTLAVVLIMLIFGLPNITIVAIAVFLVGVLPLSPSELGYAIPILLLFPTNPIAALILIPIAELIVLYTNYVLLPRVIAGGEEGNALLILTSILSGITIFRIMCFKISPVTIIFSQTLSNILEKRIRKEKGITTVDTEILA